MDMKQPWRSLYVFAFLAVLFVFTLPAQAASAINPPISFSAQANPSPSGEALLPLSAADHQWHIPVDTGWMRGLVLSPEVYSTRLVSFATEAGSMPYSDDDEDGGVIRHRGFRKFLLITLVCGGLIRILTSPSYQRFVASVLDPKEF